MFQDFLRTSPKIHNQLNEDDKLIYLPSLMCDYLLKTFKDMCGPNRELREDFRGFLYILLKYAINGHGKTQLPETGLQPEKSKKVIFLGELGRLSRKKFRMAAQAIFKQIMKTKTPRNKKRKFVLFLKMEHMNRLSKPRKGVKIQWDGNS